MVVMPHGHRTLRADPTVHYVYTPFFRNGMSNARFTRGGLSSATMNPPRGNDPPADGCKQQLAWNGLSHHYQCQPYFSTRSHHHQPRARAPKWPAKAPTISLRSTSTQR